MGRDPPADPFRPGKGSSLTAFLDTNVLIRHLTGDPPEMARRATKVLAGPGPLLLADLIVAECVYVLESFYEVPRDRVSEVMRAAIALPSVEVVDAGTLLRGLAIHELDGLHFAEACLVAQAEASGVGEIVSFDRTLDRVGTVSRREP